MKILPLTLIAATLLSAGTVSSFAEDSDSPTARQQAENLWIATGDPAFAKAAGLTETQVQASRHQSAEHVQFSY